MTMLWRHLWLSVAFMVMAFNLQAKTFKPQIYEIKDETQSKTVGYLFGTWHGYVDQEQLPKKFWTFFSKANAYAFEKSSTEESDAHVRFLKELRVRKKERLQSLLTPDQYARLSGFFKNTPSKAKSDFLDKASSFAALEFANKVLIRRLIRLYDKQRSKRKSLDSQLQNKVPKGARIFDLDQENEEFFKCIYQTDDSKNLQNLRLLLSVDYLSLVVNPKKEIKGLDPANWPNHLNSECIVTGRNQLWMKDLQNSFDNEQITFIAVGRAHVAGDEPSLINLLKKQKYKVNEIEL
jgi:uncharacterized protein YbaP (TraB family)